MLLRQKNKLGIQPISIIVDWRQFEANLNAISNDPNSYPTSITMSNKIISMNEKLQEIVKEITTSSMWKWIRTRDLRKENKNFTDKFKDGLSSRMPFSYMRSFTYLSMMKDICYLANNHLSTDETNKFKDFLDEIDAIEVMLNFEKY